MAEVSISGGMYEPLARYRHCGTLVNDKWIVYGGYCINDTLASNQVIEVFDVNTEKWRQEKVCGIPPEAILSLACASIESNMYTFGGFTQTPLHCRYYNTIHKLDICSNRWNQMSTKDEGPMPKESAVMIDYKGKILVTFGGYGPSPTRRREGVTYTEHPHMYNFVWTNELVCYEINSGMYTYIVALLIGVQQC